MHVVIFRFFFYFSA
ncbi:pheST operon leader peptide PheM [Serratia plymuthica]|uniref:pheST attenuator peptide n=1 Tax=Serratia plymuthica TaxID=82996 RepID=A0ABX6XGT8_SERPL|nr:pheST operon leader peptide PheM [Serratia plymuthica]MBL3523127.1 pheST operon leader peptide PheM [Serratia plymuthica]NIC26585.1 pheST operon leader peptide PheM [Serratia plymuthica]QPS23238.1 pheST operon leader peptide PheM [Serratia plymuthica]QPS58441.1 pheST operon leader peptide PheM [Serratia plymuthica]